MNTKFIFSLKVLFFSLLSFLPLQLFGDGLIIIDDFRIMPMPKPVRLNVKYHHVDVSINNQIAITKVDQVFENPHDMDLEGTYIFPIPEQASINNFTMYANNEPLPTKILGKDEARKIYEDIVFKQKDPALLEYLDRGMVQARVYPIKAHSETRISLEYSEVLKADNGTVKYLYTLGTEKFSEKLLNDVSVKINIQSPQNILNVYSPTHQINVEMQKPTKAFVKYEEKSVRPVHDFILYYTLPKDEIGFNVLTYKDGKEDGFLLAMMSPNKSQDKTQPTIAKNIIFVVDTSGSMMGEKIEQAKNALKFCLSNLNPQDRFNIIDFNYEAQTFQDKLVEANSQNIEQALTYAASLPATGGTNIDKALNLALSQIPASENPSMIIFLTDGQPTVGETQIAKIIKNVKAYNKKQTRLFSFGVGYDVNTTLLDKISLDNKGTSDYVRPNESIEAVVSGFYKKVANPVLTDLKLAFSGTKAKEILPLDLPDLFDGSQLLVIGRYTDGGNVSLDLCGKQNSAEKHFIFNANFANQNTENDFLPRIWASRKIASLVDKIVLDGNNKELVDEIIQLSRRYGIITEYTSFLVDADAQDFGKDLVSDHMKEMATASLNFAAKDQTGKNSVARAKMGASMRESSTVQAAFGDETSKEKIRSIRAKTFYFKNNIWIDGEHTDASQITKIKFFSKEYFDLLNKKPELATYLSVGKNIIIKTDAGSIQIEDELKA